MPSLGYEKSSSTSSFLSTPPAPLTTTSEGRQTLISSPRTQFFNSWALNNPLNGALPHSPPNVIATAAENQATNGTPSLTVLYPGSKLASFDFHDFWFGCDANTVEGAASAAVECTVAVAGFRNAKEVAVASFTFTPTAGETAATPMIHAVLPKTFVTLQNATLVQGDPAVQVILADDFGVTTHPC